MSTTATSTNPAALNLELIKQRTKKFQIFHVLASATLQICLNVQTFQRTMIDGEIYVFIHPLFQVFNISFSWLIVPLIYLIFFRNETEKVTDDKIPEENFNKMWIILPSIGYITAMTLYSISVYFLDASVFSILKGCVIITTVGMSYFLFSRFLKFYEIFGIMLFFTGLIVVSMATLIASNMPFVTLSGILYVFIAQFFDAAQLIGVEHFLKKYTLHPMKLQALKGMISFVLFGAIIFIACRIPCEEDAFLPCVNGYYEDVGLAFKEIFHNTTLLITFLLTIVAGIVSEICGVYVVKLDSALSNFTILEIKSAVVWLFFLFWPGQGHEEFLLLQLVGFTILVLGSLIYKQYIFENADWIYGREQLTEKELDASILKGQIEAGLDFDSE